MAGKARYLPSARCCWDFKLCFIPFLVKRSLPQGWRIGGLRHVDMGCTIIFFVWRLRHRGASPSPRLLEGQSFHVGVCSIWVDHPRFNPALRAHCHWLPYKLPFLHLLPLGFVHRIANGPPGLSSSIFSTDFSKFWNNRPGHGPRSRTHRPIQGLAADDQLWGRSSAEHFRRFKRSVVCGFCPHNWLDISRWAHDRQLEHNISPILVDWHQFNQVAKSRGASISGWHQGCLFY